MRTDFNNRVPPKIIKVSPIFIKGHYETASDSGKGCSYVEIHAQGHKTGKYPGCEIWVKSIKFCDKAGRLGFVKKAEHLCKPEIHRVGHSSRIQTTLVAYRDHQIQLNGRHMVYRYPVFLAAVRPTHIHRILDSINPGSDNLKRGSIWGLGLRLAYKAVLEDGIRIVFIRVVVEVAKDKVGYTLCLVDWEAVAGMWFTEGIFIFTLVETAED